MNLKFIIVEFLMKLPVIGEYIRCVKSELYPNSIWQFFIINVLGRGKHYYPIPKNCIIQHPYNIYVGKNSHPFRIGSYIQAEGGIYIGNYVDMTNYTTLMSTNHDLYTHTDKHPKPIVIKDHCWIGTHSIILPGVQLGPRTIVGAGSVVTKSFPDGYCVIAGNPAKLVKTLDRNKFVPRCYKYDYYGCLSKTKFEKRKNKYIKVSPISFGVEESL